MLRRRPRLPAVPSPPAPARRRAFRSEAALEAIRSHSLPPKAAAAASSSDAADDQAGPASLALYNYPTFAGAYAALAARLFHQRARRRLLVLPFSSVEPFSVIAFDHRQSTLARIPKLGHCPSNVELHIDTSKSSVRFVFDYFSKKLAETKSDSRMCENLFDQEDEERVSNVLKYIEDADLRRWQLPNTKEFQTTLRDERAKLNCVINPHVFEQLLQLDVGDLLTRGKSLAHDRLQAAGEFIQKPFKIRLGRGLYGECLAIRADGHSKLSHEIGLELSQRSAAAGLRPIGAVVFMQRGILKVCLRTTDNAINTAEIAKAYGGGGKPSSSSFALRMDEFNTWTSVNSRIMN
ncbi:hypothetical protein BAE44_0017174 [Dichanthelium oligosanthes]|uniref:Uncharacterized protein n=1 Tax=Dichanthelium oligosanthes TaxID=888268 RepID=A0A1E5V9W8_9POAL|nr:hypothetical protein BAE44_0017174 [Dichanthelium oligosanthes]